MVSLNKNDIITGERIQSHADVYIATPDRFMENPFIYAIWRESELGDFQMPLPTLDHTPTTLHTHPTSIHYL